MMADLLDLGLGEGALLDLGLAPGSGGGPGPSQPTSTRWRLYIEANNGGGSVSASAITMAETVDGPDLCAAATVSASSSYSGTYDAAKAVDGNDATMWVTAAADIVGAWFEAEFDDPVTIVDVGWRTRSDGYVTESPLDTLLQYWDGEGWVTRAYFRGEHYWPVGGMRHLRMTGEPASADHFFYWRARETDTFGSGNLIVTDMKMFEAAVGGSDVTDAEGGGAVATIPTAESTRADNAFPGTGVNRFIANSYPAHLGFRFATARTIERFQITASGSGEQARCYRSFVMEAGNDGSTWTAKGTVTSEAVWAAGEERSYLTT